MTIVKAPHQSLRTTAKPITFPDIKVQTFLDELGQTLVASSKRGVGLAATQVNKPWRVFATYLNPLDDEAKTHKKLTFYLNPHIVKHSPKPELGGDDDSTPLEGCLSIPGIWGPVPRFAWIEIEYDSLESGHLIPQKQRFDAFPARLVQHEIDHLDGILFTDYSLEYNLPVYTDNPKTGKIDELEDRSIIEIF